MKQTAKFLFFSTIFYLAVLSSVNAFASSGGVPTDMQVSLFQRLLFFDKSLSGGGDITIHVIGSHEFERAMKKQVGKKIGKSTLTAVTGGDGLPEKKPSVIYIGKRSIVSEAIEYTRKNKVLSITGVEALVAEGVTLGLGVEDRKPKILLNLSSSVEEGADWNHAILKVAATIK